MRIRRNYWFVPALAILGIVLAVLNFYMKSKQKPRDEVLVIDPKEPPPALPPSEPVKMEPKGAPVNPAPMADPGAAPTQPAAAPAPATAK